MPAKALFRPAPFDEWATTQPGDFVAQAERYFLRVRAFYDTRATWHRRFYRISGVVLILLGGALPLIAAGTYTSKDFIVSAVGFVVATITALRGFYRWDASWVLLRGTELTLTKRYLAWKALQGRLTDTAAQQEEAQRLLADLATVRENESKAFFKELPFPAATGDVGKDGRGGDAAREALAGLGPPPRHRRPDAGSAEGVSSQQGADGLLPS